MQFVSIHHVDEDVEYLGTKLQKLILLMLCISSLAFVFDVAYVVMTDFWYWSFSFLIGWLVLLIGFCGAYGRNKTLLFVFIILEFLYIIWTGISIIASTWIIISLSICNSEKDCHFYGNFEASIALLVIYLIFACCWWSLQIRAVLMASRLRELIHQSPIISEDYSNYAIPQYQYHSPHAYQYQSNYPNPPNYPTPPSYPNYPTQSEQIPKV